MVPFQVAPWQDGRHEVETPLILLTCFPYTVDFQLFKDSLLSVNSRGSDVETYINGRLPGMEQISD